MLSCLSLALTESIEGNSIHRKEVERGSKTRIFGKAKENKKNSKNKASETEISQNLEESDEISSFLKE